MESEDADDTPIPMLQILGRNESSGTISSLITTRSRISCEATAIPLLNPEADDNDDDANEADAKATSSTMMLSHRVTQSQIKQNNHWNEELDRDGGDSDEEGSLADAFDVQIQGCNNGKDKDAADNNNNNNNNNELHVGMQGGYYYKDGTQVEEATTYPKPPQDYSSSDNNKSKLGEPSWHDVDNPVPEPLLLTIKGWKFHYQNWVPEEDTPIFSQRKGKLDMAKLRKYGLQLGRVRNSDALFFYQLLLPFHTNEEDDKQDNETRWKPFYSKVLKWSNNYANQSNTGKGHYVRRIKLSELVHFDGFVYLHGALERKKGSICYRWTNVDTLYSCEIATKMSWYWWRQIKSNLKLNCNHETKYNRLLYMDDMSKFTYACKFDYIYETLIHNVHYFSKKGCSDLCMDKSSWAYYRFGGPMVDYLKGKMFSRGGQMVILSDGCSAVQDIFTKYVIPEIGKLWSSPSHLTADNFFNGDALLDWMGGLDKKYFHKENVSSASAKRCSRIARLCNSVTMLAGLQRGTAVFIAHSRPQELAILALLTVLIQMVSSCDRNNLDQIDSAISRSNIGYKSWKYYHAPINHAKALPVLTAFNMYQELTGGTHGISWHLPKRQQLDFRQFKQKLAEKMLVYNPSDNKPLISQKKCYIHKSDPFLLVVAFRAQQRTSLAKHMVKKEKVTAFNWSTT
eukprot:jgi/Psemu1/25419/gm1.25419_g